jgi:hypothetical protein
MSSPSRPSRFGNLRRLKEQGEMPADGPDSVPAATAPAIPHQIAPEAAEDAMRPSVPPTIPVPHRDAEIKQGTKARGKSKRDDYRSTTIYVPASVHDDAVDKLRLEHRSTKKGDARRDLSDVIGALLAGWAGGRFEV